jgi:hypothetical protein
MKKVISFSLYGDNPKYTMGMIRNLEIIEKLYSDWTTYIYYNETLPTSIIEKIKEFNNVELNDMTTLKIPGMFWRFLPNDDSDVDRFIVRDSDSRITKREVEAVNEWVNGGKILHIMRDHPHHNYVILGGMWGMKCQKDFNMKEYFMNYTNSTSLFEKMTDMNFLRDVIYPKYKDNSCVHATYHKKEKWSKPFTSNWVDYKFVGEIFDEYNNRDYHYTLLKK